MSSGARPLPAPASPGNWLPAELRASGFTEPSLSLKYSLSVASTALEKRGKTTWALTVPEPLVVLSTDTGTEEIAEQARRAGRKVALSKIRVPKEKEAQSAKEKEWENAVRVFGAVAKAAASGAVRSFVMDTGTEIWELVRLARFGKLAQVQSWHYGPVNAEIRDIIKELCEIRTLNSVWVHKSKKQYAANKKGEDAWNGQYERAGYGDIGYLCDVVVRHERQRDETGVVRFKTFVDDSRFEAQTLIGMELEDDLNNFSTLAQLCFPNSTERDWA